MTSLEGVIQTKLYIIPIAINHASAPTQSQPLPPRDRNSDPTFLSEVTYGILEYLKCASKLRRSETP